MKVMILSDSHMMPKADLLELLKQNHVDYYIHCGDIFMPYDNINLNNFYLVRGNNDYAKIKDEIFITIDNLKFYIVHGHLYDVYYDTHYLYQTARKKNADIVCFGHTHQPYVKYTDNLIMINPGSVSYPRGQYQSPTYCIFDTENKEITYYDAITLEPCNPFSKTQHLKKEPFYKRWFKH